jgi:hypothetical protein
MMRFVCRIPFRHTGRTFVMHVKGERYHWRASRLEICRIGKRSRVAGFEELTESGTTERKPRQAL